MKPRTVELAVPSMSMDPLRVTVEEAMSVATEDDTAGMVVEQALVVNDISPLVPLPPELVAYA